jgi:hypothetical protein
MKNKNIKNGTWKMKTKNLPTKENLCGNLAKK